MTHDLVHLPASAVNSLRHKILRIDREEMIDDIISHDKK